MDSELSGQYEVKVGMLQGYVLPPILFVVVVDVVTELAKGGALCQLLYIDDLVVMSETIKGLRNKFLIWKGSFEKVYLGKTKVMVSGQWSSQRMACLKVKFNHVGYVA